ncbi:MAG: hypothetical protein IJ533_04520 [Prevotella sp.]|nr:hypothetical protein [Prevotella sp.]
MQTQWDNTAAPHQSSDYIQFEITEVEVTYTYHLISRTTTGNKEVFSYKVANPSPSATVALDANLVSPYATNYHYYDSSSKAAANTAASDFSTYADVTGTDIYVGYDYDASAGLDLTGATTYSYSRESDHVTNSLKGSTSSCRPTETFNATDLTFYWRFYGQDPYAITVRNASFGGDYYHTSQNTAINNHNGSNSKLVSNSDTSYDVTTWSLLANDKLAAFAKRDDVQYFVRWKNNGVNVAWLYHDQLTTPSTADFGYSIYFLERTPPVRVYYRIINKSGKQAGADIPADYAPGTVPVLPTAYQSPLATNYTYYSAATENGGVYTIDTANDEIVPASYSPATNDIIYVLYDYNANNSITFGSSSFKVDLTGQTKYVLNLDPASTRYLAWQVNATGSWDDVTRHQLNFSVTTTPSEWSDALLWTFSNRNGTPDPYDIVIRNARPDLNAFFVTPQSGVGGNGSHTWLVGDDVTSSCVKSWMLLTGNKLVSEIIPGVSGNKVVYWANSGWTYQGDFSAIATNTSAPISLVKTYVYHLINLGDNGTGTNRRDALRIGYTYTGSNTTGLPAKFKSPLASSFKYFLPSEITAPTLALTGNVYNYQYTTVPTTPTLTEGSSTVPDVTDIYVTYSYDDSQEVQLDNATQYNIKLNDKYLRGRGYGGSGDTSNDWSSDAYSYTTTDGLATINSTLADDNEQLLWQLRGSDPYAVLLVPSQVTTAALGMLLNSNYTRYFKIGQTSTAIAVDHYALLSNENATNGKGDYEMLTIMPDGSLLPTTQYLGCSGSYPEKGTYTTTTQRQVDIFQPKRTYVYNIVDMSGRIAIKYSAEQPVKTEIDTNSKRHDAIPSAIYSPYLANEDITFYTTFSAEGDRANLSSDITALPGGLTNHINIYVSYTNTHLEDDDKALHLRGVRGFSMKINGEYVYESSSAFAHESTDAKLSNRDHMWYIGSNTPDPYAVQVQNVENGDFFTYDAETPSAITLTDGTSNNTRFIIMAGSDDGYDMQIELMAATGSDASTAYYSVGRESGDPQLYGNSTKPHGHASLQILLKSTTRTITYKVVDKQHKIVLSVNSESSELALPAAWVSPLATNYQYWVKSNFTLDNPSNPTTFTLKESQTPISGTAESADGDIYVTYDLDTSKGIDLNSGTDYTERVSRSETNSTQVRNSNHWGTMYMLQFTGSDNYYLEDGNDDIETTVTASGTHLYPYTNGDGPLYIRQQSRWDTEKDAGASTRTRWPWFLLSPNDDPYHVMITSWQNSHANSGTNYYSFLRTYYNETLSAIVTNNVTDDPRTVDGNSQRILPTEYMILSGDGSTGDYRLVTTNEITDAAADATYGNHRPVTSFEQYWRNNPTALYKNARAIKGSALTKDEKNALKTGQSALASDNANLTTNDWHNYEHYVNAAKWDGSKYADGQSKNYLKEDHWFMTVNMGNGSFNLIPTEIDAVLVLLDNHGWEVMRQNIAKHTETTKYEAARTALRKYDSPMVSEYKFYAYRTPPKVPGYHKYTVSGSTAGTATSLADYPESWNGGALVDLYVTYSVKPEYSKAYTGAATEANTTKNYPFLIRQDGNLATAASASSLSTTPVSSTGIDSGTDTGIDIETHGNLYWYLKPNFNIDREMGYQYDVTKVDATDADGNVTASHVPDETETNKAYDDNNQSGFDPYNIQIESYAHSNSYLQTNYTAATLESNIWTGTGATGVKLDALPSTLSATGHDQTTMAITNATFMAIQDANGNMRLMPRFDYSHVVQNITALAEPVAAQPADDKAHGQTTILLRPTPYTYIIIDNQGREALRYTALSSGSPVTPVQFRSPLAKDFTYWKKLDGVTLSEQISGSFADADLSASNPVYVRYVYDSHADTEGLLRGTWLTMKLNNTDVQYADNLIKNGTKDADNAAWQWRLLQSSTSDRDPYAIQLYNNDGGMTNSMSTSTLAGGTVTANASGTYPRFVLLRHSDGTSYALAAAGTETNNSYYFLNGNALATGAVTTAEAATFAANGTLSNATRVAFSADVVAAQFTYKIITHTGKVALTGTITKAQAEALSASHATVLPVWMRSPLMKPDAYTFYTAATGNDTEGYTVNTATETTSLLNGDDLNNNTLYVRYDYNADTRTSVAYGNGRSKTLPYIDLSGNVAYHLQNYEYYWDPTDNGENNVGVIMHSASNLGWSYRSVWSMTGNDPYEITITQLMTGRKATAAIPTAQGTAGGENNRKYLLVYTNPSSEYKSTFMILNGHSNTDALNLYVTGNDNVFVCRYTNSNNGSFVTYNSLYDYKDIINNVHTREISDADIRFQLTPAALYSVITNDGRIAVQSASDYNETTLVAPEEIMSPLLNNSDFTYYKKATSDGGIYTVTPSSAVALGTPILDVINSTGSSYIYMRYTYERETSPFMIANAFSPGSDDETELDWSEERGLDLKGETWYNIANMIDGRYQNTDFAGNLLGSSSATSFSATGVGTAISNGKLSSKTNLWRFEGNDPYAIVIYNCEQGDKVVSINPSNNNRVLMAEKGTYSSQSFMFLGGEQTDGRWDVMMHINSKYYLRRFFSLFVTGEGVGTGSLRQIQSRASNNGVLDSRAWSPTSLTSNRYRMSGNQSEEDTPKRTVFWVGGGGNGSYIFEFVKAPVARKYRYHAIRYNGTSKVGETWTATMEHDWLMPLVLEDNIARLYCKYEKNTVEEADDVTGSNTFDTRAALEALDNAQFYSDAALTQRVFDEDATTHKKTYDVYPAIDTETICDIYFKYQVDTETAIGGLTLGDITSTAAEVAADVAYRKEKGQIDEEHLKNDVHANWYYMVLDTDYDLTATGTGAGRTFTGKQRFLRREDNGTVGWMDNAYALHYQNTDNLNNWSYNRLAESYRQGENDAFREGRWLWTFMGDDPYNLRVLNLETAVGVTATGKGVYTMPAADDCWTTITKRVTETRDNKGNVTGTTTSYPVTVPTERPAEGPAVSYTWGIMQGSLFGSGEQTFNLVSTAMTEERDGVTMNLPLCWQMVTNETTKADSVAAMTRTNDRQNAIRLLKYEPMKYQDVNLVVKRDDHVAEYKTWKAANEDATADAKRIKLKSYDSGISLLYYTASERAYAAGDLIDMSRADALPLNVRRAFCTYKVYSDDFENEGGIYTVKDGPYPYKAQQATITGKWTETSTGVWEYVPGSGDLIVDEDGRAVYPYINEDGTPALGGAQSLYAQYTVTSDVFLKTAPTKTEVAAMAENNDHVYFMDFPDTNKDGSDNTHHAFFDTDAKFRIQTGDLSKKVDKKSGTWRTEKRVWDGAKFVDDTATPYNYCQFRTTDNRMISVPEHLKWYFVGDPYRVQVFNAYEYAAWNETEITDTKGTKWAAGTKAANLARFSTVETNFQFVVDCVHLQVPDYTNIDNRPELYPTDEMGNRLDPIPNRNEGKPYYNDFYWECVPTVSDDPNAFALRFKEDNDLLGYRNVYYYLAHEGLTKQYRQDGDNVTYHINLNYKADNEQYTSGDYIGYHKANDQNTVIRLVQPVKLYVSANRQSDSRYDAKSNVTTDELSEYYGLGETVEEVPRHLQRKFVSYDWTNLELTDANKYSSTACTDHASDVFVSPNDVNYVFKRTVNYTVKDLTSDGVHLFSSCSDPANPLSTELQWLDVMIGNNNWLYYDKTNVDAEGNENQTTLVSNYARALSADKKGWYGTANGWTDGLKGLHWAFIGDPYDFTVVNRRRFEDGGGTGDQWLQSSDNLVMTATAGSATHYATKMWKTGGDSEYILTTKDIAKRMVAQKSTTEFRLMDHQLTDRRIYTANENDLNYENYVVNGYCYNPTLAGLGGMQQKLQIRTAVAKDEDNADNDCFDTGVRIYSATGIRRIEIDDMEIKYGKAGDVLPISLRRYGCTYDCYLVTDGDSVKIDDFDAATTLTSTDANINGKTFREFVATGTKFHLSYVYNVENDAAQFFTSTSDAMTEDYTWMNTYFSWDQYYSGTNVEVEYYEREFDHYVYNAQGAIIDEVYNMIRRTKVDPNPQQAYPTTAYLNSHTGQSNIYADEGTQSEKDRQKWSLVGDPYEFTMKNYAQYLVNGSSVLTMDGKNVSSTNNAAQSQNFTIAVDKSGNTYLAIVGDNGQILQCITFEFSTTSDKELFSKGTGTNQHDPTGNTLDTKDVKPFKLANLIRYADILQYHLVIAHQHSLDHTDELSDDNAKILKDHLLEYLKYQGIRKNVPGMYVNSEVSEYLVEKKDEITTLLKKNASLRDFISYPIEDYSVSRVGIGNHPQVPWYMKRQFCRYYLYQRDVLRSVTLDGSFDYDGDGVVGDEDDIKLAYKKDENGNYLDEDGNITTDPEKRVQLWIDKANNKPAYEITWESIDNKTFWDAWNTDEDGNPETGPNKDRAYKKSDGSWLKKPKYYDEAMALNGKVLDKLQDCHFNRKVKIDVVYEVIPEEFQFATRGRNTTAWYQMMTNNEADGLMNFTYKNGIGARLDRIEHYTNNYLWAPEGDPYGFVLRSRYATINGTGWDNVAVTTKGHLPKSSTDPVEADYTPAEIEAGAISKFQANYTNEAQFDDKRIIHKLKGEGEDDATSDGPSNAVYEMFTGNAAYTNSFLMHPTSAYINTADTDFESYYMTHDTKTNISKLVLTSGRALQTNADANWSLHATAEQLLPYFERAGYVGGLDPKKATDDFSYHDYYEQLKAAKKNGTRLDFATLRKIQDIVYEGTFYQNDGTTEVMEGSKRPDQEYLPMKFKAANLVNMAPGYYRIKAFSEDALNYDGEDMSDTGIKGIIGPRYISAYRFESEKVDNPSTETVTVNGKDYTPDTLGGRWLHFNETDMKHATIHTYADLKAKITAVNAAVASSGKSDAEKALLKDRDVFDHAAMHGNIEILPADFDPSSIFYFTEANATYGQYSLATQGLQLRARPGGTQAEAGVIDAECGHTEMVDATSELKEGYRDVFRLDDIGGAAVTLRTFDAAPSGTAWDTEVKTTLTTNYVCIDGHHRYRITCHKDNEMVEVGDHYTTDGLHGIQDTKWLLQPVGIREQWPYNEMPLRVEVQKGGFDKSGNEDNHYYGSLYVPFDTRLGNPADAAFTLTTPTITDATTSVTMSSVSQLNEMGNPQFVPANWPVVVRTTNVKNVVTLENQPVGEADPTTYATRHYVNMYIPNATPTIPNTIDGGSPAIKLKGQFLEQELPADAAHTIMVFGLPFKTSGDDAHDNTHHVYDTSKQVGWYTNDNWARSTRNDGWPTAAYSDYKPHDGSYPTAATVATHTQRSNKYVYHNKVYYVLDKAYEAPSSRHIVAIFDGDTDDEEQRPIDITDKADTPWPCDVYDTAGRRVAENETPSTLLKNHPALRRGVYIFGGRKVVVK